MQTPRLTPSGFPLPTHPGARLTALILAAAAAPLFPLRAAPPLGFEEKFALAPDRAAVLKDLVAGSPEHFYYATLHAQNSRQFPEATQLLKDWAARYPDNTPERSMMETRQHFLDYSTNPQATLDWLRATLALSFDHARETAGTPPEIPTQLDPALISWDAFYGLALQEDGNLGTLTDSGLRNLFHKGLAKSLPPEARRAVLQRLTRPDLPGLTELILTDLGTKASQGFGEFAIHKNLLLPQLEALLAARPALLEKRAFVETLLARLTPPDGADPDRDPAVRLAWLERLQSFADRLAPSFNSLKASILHARLVFDLRQNAPNQARVIAYLKLPRPVPYLNPVWREKPGAFQYQADLTSDFQDLIGSGPIHDDTGTVRRSLLWLLAKNPDTSAFAPLLESTFLNALLAEARLTANPTEADQYTALLTPAELQKLRTRTDLEFDAGSKESWLPEDEVSLDLHLKNIPRLLIKVYEINTENVHRATGRQVNTDLDLDGLVANQEISKDYQNAPLLRTRETFKFPQLNGRRGVWIIEFIGGGKSSRALIRKGGLTVLPVATGAGTRLTVLDEKSAPVPTATAHLGGQQFTADAQGHILLPFSTTPGEQNVIVSDGAGFTTLETLTLQGENYSVRAGLHVPRESLLPGHTATVLLRPILLSNGRPTPLKALQKPKLTLTTNTLEGIPSTTVYPLSDLAPDKETTVSFQVPDRLANVTFTFSGEVTSRLTSQPVEVSTQQTIEVNGLTNTATISDVHLTPGQKGWTLTEAGRTGEPLADRQLNVRLIHPDFTTAVTASLRTDASGAVSLGELADLATLQVNTGAGLNRTFPIPRADATLPDEIGATAGQTVRLAWPWQVPAPDAKNARPVLTILETRRGTFVRPVTAGIAFKDGLVEISGLDAGSYSLFSEEKFKETTLTIAAGKVVDGHLLNPSTTLELSGTDPVAITSLTPGQFTPKDAAAPVDVLRVHIANAGPATRVHVLVSRFLPEFDAFAALSGNGLPELTHESNVWRPSLYQSARTIGEEYRYVLERQGLKAFAGNLLPRPGLLLNPWAIAETTTETQVAAEGEALKEMVAEKKSEAPAKAKSRKTVLGLQALHDQPDLVAAQGAGVAGKDIAPQRMSADLSFLAEPGATAYNLQPDAEGNIHIAAADLGHGQMLRVVAVSGETSAVRDFVLPDKPIQVRDLRLAKGLDPAGHFAQQNTVTVLEKEVPFTLKDALSARYRLYGDLDGAWDLLTTLSKNPILAQFAFLRSWPTLDDAAKRALYSKFACHELSFFLSRKDPEFFKSVIQPYLANKRDRTFMDDYLLQGSTAAPALDRWLNLTSWQKLNTAEKLLFARAWDQSKPGADAPQLATAARDLDDFLNTIRRDPAKETFWFESALGSISPYPIANPIALGRSLFLEGKADAFHSSGTLDINTEGFRYSLPASAAAPAPAPATAAPADNSLVELRAARSHERLKEANMGEDWAYQQAAKNQPLYRQTELTREFAENNYYQVPNAYQNAGLIRPNRFWQDYAHWDGKGPFLSANLAEATNNFPEMMLALAVLDLPFATDTKSGKSEMKDGVLTIVPAGRSLLFRQEIKAAEPDKDGLPLLVSQNFYRADDRFTETNGEQSDKFVEGEFLAGVVYGSRVVVTNPSSGRRKLEVLFQIPAGAVPVEKTRVTQSLPITLEGFHTQTLDFSFYFPQPGEFAHYPVHVSRDGKIAAAAAPATFKVVKTLTTLDKTSWEYVSQHGTTDEVIAWLGEHNLHAIDLDRAAWRLKDPAFYSRLMALLRGRKHFDDTVFSYGILHKDVAAIRDYLPMVAVPENRFNAGGVLDSPLLTLDPIQEKTFQWLEYSPLVNARAHRLGADRVILNNKFRAQYSAYLRVLSFRPDFSDEEKLGLAEALLLQDRLEESAAWLAAVKPENIHERLQYDYLQAWLALSAGDLPTARRVATARAGSPLPDHWLNKFQELTAQLDEIDGKTPANARPEDRDAMQGRLAAAEAQYNVKVEAKAVTLDYRNLTEVTVNYYPMDLEFLFSANPFVSQDTARFRSIRPNQTERLTLAPDKTTHTFPLPAAWQNTNVLVEITAAGQTKAVASYANQLDVQVSENYGQIQVRHAGDHRPLPKTYVKVFAQIDGRPVFYKDGYTDLRGKFDYTSLSTSELDKTTRFSLLILSTEHGATVREAAPPAR